MFAAILNSFFIVLLSMVFVQRNLIEINIYKNFEMSTKDRINLSQCSRNNKEIHTYNGVCAKVYLIHFLTIIADFIYFIYLGVCRILTFFPTHSYVIKKN
jgi:hypothetical protein